MAHDRLRVSGYPKDGTRRWVTEEVASLEGPFQVVGTPVDFERLVDGVWVSTDQVPDDFDAD